MTVFWGGLANGFYEGVDQARARKKAQQDADEQQQEQQAYGALAKGYADYIPPPPQTPQPPPPGQQSPPGQSGQPQQQGGPPPGGAPQGPPGGGMPPPQGQMQPPPPQQRPPMQMPPQGGGMQPPPGLLGAPGGQNPMQRPPQQPMGGQPQPPQGQMPAPPQDPKVQVAIQSALPDLHTMAKTLSDQGIKGMPLFKALMQHQQFLSQDGKQQLAELTLQLRTQVQEQQNQIRQQQVGVNQQNANTKGQDADRRTETAAGTNAMGRAIIDNKTAGAEGMRARAEVAKAKVSGALSGGTGGSSGGGASGYSKEDISDLAKQANTGDASVLQGYGVGKKAQAIKEEIRKEMLRQNRIANLPPEEQAAKNAEFFGMKAGERTLGTRTANVELAVNEAKNFTKLALDASDKVDRTSYPDFNKLLLAGEKKTGNEAVVRFYAANNSLINAYARAVSPTGQPTVSDKNHAREILETNWSKGQYRAGVEQLNSEMDAARQAPGAVRKEFRESVTGKSGDVAPSAPKVGDVKSGYRFKGGDPAKQTSWEKV